MIIRLNPLSLALTLPCLAALAVADPAPKEDTATPISAANVNQVRSVKEVPKTANRIVRGPNHGELIIFDWNNAAEVVDDMNLHTMRTLPTEKPPTDIAVSPDGKLVAWNGGGRKSYTVQETDGGKTVDIEIGEHPGRAAFSPDGKLLAIGFTYWDPNAEGAGYSEMRVFDVKGKLLRSLEKNRPGALQPVFSPDGKTLAVGNRNYETQLFDAAKGELLHKLYKRMTQEVAFSPDGKTLACG
ncbi:MAG: WD40 repeat domain-containing protein [Planctomycetaceae bacterium]|nr:WD40 repeat domain-containing protein [Planctomycetaceae bacterium]